MKLESQLQVFTASGVAPFTVNQATLVTNLNAQYLGGQLGSYFEGRDTTAIGFSGGSITLTRTAGNISVSLDGRYLPLTGGALTGALTGTTGSFSGQITSTQATGTAPFSISSTTRVDNLNVQYLNGQLGTYYAAASSLTNYLPLSGGQMTGYIGLQSAGGTNGFYTGNSDAATYALYNFKLSGWNGMAFENASTGGAYPSQVVGVIDFRNGTIDMKGGFKVNGASVITENQSITISGDASGSGKTAISLTLASVGTAGTYRSVTTDAKGRVTAGTNPTTLSGYGITDALPLAGGTLTGAITVNGISDAVGVQTNGNAAQWYGRISVRNSTSDKSSFLGTYQGIAGVFAHNNALNAWADLYINTVDGSGGGIVRMSADVRIGGNAAIHAGNYTSYPDATKLPLTGGTLTGNLTAPRFISNQATGTAPFGVTSTTVVTNLNADLLDGQEGSFYQSAANLNAGTIPAARLPAYTGDVTSTVGTVALTLAASGATAGTYNNVTVNAKGLVTGGSNASYLTSNQSISITGDATGSGSTGIVLTLANVLATPGTYTKVTANAKGLITAGAALASADLPTYTGTITSGQVTTGLGFTPYNATNPSGYITSGGSISGNAATATNGFTFKPGWAGNQNLIAATGNVNSSVPSGFYEAYQATNSPTPTTWCNLINVRHSNTGNDHGFQLAMSYYDETLWSRSYQGGTGANNGTFTTWRAHLHSGNFNSYALPLAGGTLTGSITATNYIGPGTGLTGTATSLNIGGTAATATNVAWSGITSKPTTLAGYGITDAASINGATNQVFNTNALYIYEWIRFKTDTGIYWDTGTYAGWHIYPQALWGMSLRSASTDCGLQLRRSTNVLLGSVYSDGTSIGFLDASNGWGASFTITGAMNRGSVPGSLVTGNISGNAGTATNVAWSGITSKPTTISGFGITDTIPLLASIVEADLNTATATGFRLVSKTGHSSALFTINVGGSTGPVQLDANYFGLLRWRNQTDSGAANWTAWKTLIHDGNYTSYPDTTKLPLTGGTLTGALNGTTAAFSGAITQGGNQVLHAGNFSAYALPYTGGTLTGSITATNFIGLGTGLTGTATSLSIGGNAATATRTNSQSGYAHAGTGMVAFYNWGGTSQGTNAPDAGSYTTGISVGSHPNDQAYGFQIANNMWASGLWTRNYNSGFGSWVRLLDSSNYTSYPDATKLPLAGGTLTGSITATNHIGPGTGLTGTAAGLNIGGNANNITQYTVNQSVGTGNSPSFTGLSVINTITGAVSGSSGSCTGNAASASSLAADTSTRFKIITFTGVGGDSGNGSLPDSYAIYQQGGSWTNPYPDLCIGYHTGIKIGAYYGYGGTRFFNNSDWATEIFSVGNGDSNVRVVNTIYAATFSGPLMGNVTGNVTGNLTGTASSATTAGNVNGYGTSTGVGANTIVVRDANGYIFGYYFNSNVSESENPSVNSFFTSNGDGYLRKATVAHVKYTLSLSGTNTGDQTNISGSSGSCSGNAASVTDGVYLSTTQSISGVKTFSSAPIATNIAKAWVYYNMNNNTINASYNVSSVTDNGTGVCTVNFSTAMVDSNYVVAGTATYGYDDQDIYAMTLAVPRRSTAQQAGSCRLATEFIHAAQVYDCVAVRAVFYR